MRLNYCGLTISLARYFLHAIHSLTCCYEKMKIKILVREQTYVHIWLKFISSINAGISINNIIFRLPTHIHWDDSYIIWIGGVSTCNCAYRYSTRPISKAKLQITPWSYLPLWFVAGQIFKKNKSQYTAGISQWQIVLLIVAGSTNLILPPPRNHFTWK